MPIHEINGCPMHYHVSGSGTPIIFIHPPLLTKANFVYQTSELSNDFKIVLFDIRGHGRSGFSEQPLSYPIIAEDIRQLMNHLDIEKAYLCGYSTGGTIALEAMLNFPDRFKGAILVSAMSKINDLKTRTRLSLAVALTRLGVKRLVSATVTLFNAESRSNFIHLYRDANHGHVRNWYDYYKYSMDYDCTERLKAIKHPILLLYGVKDSSFVRYGRLLQRELPHAEAYTFKEPHHIPTKAALAMNDIIRRWIHLREEEKEHVVDTASAEQELARAVRETSGHPVEAVVTE